MTIWEHLAELRSRIFKVAIAVGRGHGRRLVRRSRTCSTSCWSRSTRSSRTSPLIATEPLQTFTLRLQMSLYIGIAVAMPVILWQLWRFITPALYPHEKKYAIPFIVSALVLFVLGACVAYVILNPTLEFLVNIGGPDIEPYYTAQSYITLIVWMMLAFGVGFEFPVVIVALELLGVVTPRRLLGWWRPALVIIVVVAAVITPSGDPISMTALAVPMALLYGVSIGIGALLLKLVAASSARPTTPSGRHRRRRQLSPHEARAVPRAGHPRVGPSLGAVTDTADRGFALDRFQLEAIDAIDAGRVGARRAPRPGRARRSWPSTPSAVALADGRPGVLHDARSRRSRTRSTATSCAVHGADRVGLLTGDNAINGDAPVVVMTTEVLRNMIYAGSPALDRLEWVVLDEVHYLQDAYRGPVWEEVIIHLPAAVRLVCLSATVSNADELADWIGRCGARPRRSSRTSGRSASTTSTWWRTPRPSSCTCCRPSSTAEPNPEAAARHRPPRDAWRGRGGGRPRRRYATPRRVEVVELLGRARRCSRRSTSSSAGRPATTPSPACSAPGCGFTGPEERARIREIVERHVANLERRRPRASSATTAGSPRLEAGIAAHHAGMVPPFKEAVEACFVEGLVKVVFATETLALGINMPARTVVIEKLTKFTGERHEFLTPGQYTQLTGRAGRRGIDDHGHAVVLWNPFVPFDQVAALAASRSFRLTRRSAPPTTWPPTWCAGTRPTRPTACSTCRFAQYQADAEVVRLEQRLAQRRERLDELRAEATCERGDVDEYRRLLEGERSPKGAPKGGRASAVEDGLRALRPGDVLWLDGSGGHGRVAVLSVSHRKGGAVRVKALTAHRRVLGPRARRTSTSRPRSSAPSPCRRPYTPMKPAFQKQVATDLERFAAGGAGSRPRSRRPQGPGQGRSGARWPAGDAPRGRPLGPARPPGARLPRPRRPPRALRRAERLERELADTERQVRSRTGSLVDTFDRVLQLLEAWGHLDGWALTAAGEQLVRIYHECDLLIAEALEEGLFDDLAPDATAGLASAFVYESRNSGPDLEPWFPNKAVAARADRLTQLAVELQRRRAPLGLPATRVPDAAFFPLAHAWAAGDRLDHVLGDEGLTGRRLRAHHQAAHRPAAPDRRRRHRPHHVEHRPPGRRRRAPRRRVGVVGDQHRRRTIPPTQDLDDSGGAGTDDTAGGVDRGVDGIAEEHGRDDLEGQPVRRARCPARRRGGRGSDAEAAAVVTEARRGGHRRPAARPPRWRPVPHPRRARRRRPAPRPGGHHLPGRSGLRAARRPPPLVRRPPGRPPAPVVGPVRRGHERRVARRPRPRPPGPPGRRPARPHRRPAGTARPPRRPAPGPHRQPPAPPGPAHQPIGGGGPQLPRRRAGVPRRGGRRHRPASCSLHVEPDALTVVV